MRIILLFRLVLELFVYLSTAVWELRYGVALDTQFNMLVQSLLKFDSAEQHTAGVIAKLLVAVSALTTNSVHQLLTC